MFNVLFPTDECEIETFITNAKPNCSSGNDGLSSNILKIVAHNLVQTLSHAKNCSFISGSVPLGMK